MSSLECKADQAFIASAIRWDPLLQKEVGHELEELSGEG